MSDIKNDLNVIANDYGAVNLLPCAFCGSDGEFYESEDFRPELSFAIICTNPACEIETQTSLDMMVPIERWNRRVS